MKDVPLEDPIAFVGALDLDRSATGVTPRRLPAWTKPQIPELPMDVVVQMPSGVRLRFVTDATAVELDVMLNFVRVMPSPLRPAVFDLLTDGALTSREATTEGNVITVVGPTLADVTFDPGEPTTVRFEALRPGAKLIELWLPQATVVELRAVRVDDEAVIEAAPDPATPRWVHHGSSISHCAEAETPTGTWPAVAARDAGVELLNLGLAGQCMLDPFVARTIRDLPTDVISLKVGINLVNGDTMRERTFGPAVHGFLDTIREGHPATPILLVSPIYCPSVESRPGPTVMDASGRFVTVDGLEELRVTSLTLQKIRSALASVVEQRRELGDSNLHYLDGLELFGADDAEDLPDDLHPNAAGYIRIGHRFAQHAFAPGGPLAVRQ
ncbi:MAG: SGNH/GDSL hydrolase family protein [Acidimicrobiia bacterium]